jgi:hypothetical protein
MAVTIVDTLVTTEVTLGLDSTELIVTQEGTISVPNLGYSFPVVYAPSGASSVSLVNQGIIAGSVILETPATVINHGSIGGGPYGLYLEDGGFVANYGHIGEVGASAIGVALNSATLVNAGTIGEAGGGVGVDGGGQITNTGLTLQLHIE